ncbi:hypothetical protein 2AV2_169 [Nodularia phage vB_NpeS-2AV2]|uniref:Uncharacterized protein n=1 Tax=Nodularia phage vB_NpeS-2AV2 TaxID=1777122 RepID=A0A1L2BX64_9CAUD|nr:hypothetical protein HWA92_gp169 [Nodularia phage vB_NpeS-2AV2]ALY07621.1 hypothetical protein 2AV2_169 [Nodularia phage vB_NpeS-2AV2]
MTAKTIKQKSYTQQNTSDKSSMLEEKTLTTLAEAIKELDHPWVRK